MSSPEQQVNQMNPTQNVTVLNIEWYLPIKNHYRGICMYRPHLLIRLHQKYLTDKHFEEAALYTNICTK